MKRRWIPLVVLVLLALAPGAAHACSVCFDPRDKSNGTFLLSTAFLSLVPVGILGSMGMWLRKRLRDVRGGEEDDEDRPPEE